MSNHRDIQYVTSQLRLKGFLTPSDHCEECGRLTKTETHHYNYDNPLNFLWLCKTCHINKHRDTMFLNTKPIHSEPRGSLYTYC